MFIISIISVILLFGFLFLPIGYLNDKVIVLLPLFTENLLDNGIWEWQNSAASVLTYFISLLLLVYFRSKQQKLGIGIGFVINVVSVLILFAIVWMMEVRLSADYPFSYGYGWLFWLLGLVLFFISRHKKTGS